MFGCCVVLMLLLSGGAAFFIHSVQDGLCLQDSAGAVGVVECDLDSESQRWTWKNRAMLMSAASSRCLWAGPGQPARTLSCDLQDTDASGLLWDCDRDRLISRNSSMLLAVTDRHVSLSSLRRSRWRSLDGGDICRDQLRLRRASEDTEEDEFTDEQTSEEGGQSDQQRQLLQWFYRTEDPTTWKFVLLGVAFVCLLIGFLLLGMGSMANKNRKKIAKYKAAASLAQKAEGEELRGFSSISSHSELQANQEAHGPKAGSIVVTWRDGNTSCLYPDHTEQEKQEGKEEELGEQQKAEEQQQDEPTPE